MTTDRKRRSDAWDRALTEEQLARIADRMRRFPWYDVAPWVAEEFKVKRPSRSALYKFSEWFRTHEEEFVLRQRLRDGQALERELNQAGAADPAKLAAALGNDVIAARAKGDDQAVDRAVRAYRAVAAIVVDSREHDLKLRRLALLESKLAAARKTGATVDPVALAEEIDRLLGRKQP